MNKTPNQISNAAASPSFTPTAARKGWFSRNWKWFVPTLLIALFGLPVALIGTVFAAMKNSDVAKEALLRAQANPLLVQKLGKPIEAGWLVSGSINVSGASGDADLAVPISGPKGQGKIYVTARKGAGAWEYRVMLATVEGSDQRINLLSDTTAGTESPATPPIPQIQPTEGTSTVETQPAAPVSQPAGLASSTPAAEAAPAADQAGVIQTQETTAQGIVAEIIECRRKEGVLTLKVRFRNTSNKTSSLTLIRYPPQGDHERFYVTAGNKKYFILKDSDGIDLSSNSVGNDTGNSVKLNLEPGQTFLWWAKYPAPSADVKKINLMMPVVPPFEDVPITDK
jgi:Cytochrome oxidase complex assembly protein 1